MRMQWQKAKCTINKIAIHLPLPPQHIHVHVHTGCAIEIKEVCTLLRCGSFHYDFLCMGACFTSSDHDAFTHICLSLDECCFYRLLR